VLLVSDPSGLRERLAALEHARWARRQRYMHEQCVAVTEGSAIPWELWERWQRQIATDYADLSESEKDSDRKEADVTLTAVAGALLEMARAHEAEGTWPLNWPLQRRAIVIRQVAAELMPGYEAQR
jgi:hypothetical protein